MNRSLRACRCNLRLRPFAYFHWRSLILYSPKLSTAIVVNDLKFEDNTMSINVLFTSIWSHSCLDYSNACLTPLILLVCLLCHAMHQTG